MINVRSAPPFNVTGVFAGSPRFPSPQIHIQSQGQPFTASVAGRYSHPWTPDYPLAFPKMRADEGRGRVRLLTRQLFAPSYATLQIKSSHQADQACQETNSVSYRIKIRRKSESTKDERYA